MMKKQKFYPKQVFRTLAGKDLDRLSDTEVHVFSFFMRRARKYSLPIGVLNSPVTAHVHAGFPAGNEATAKTILANCNSRIVLKVPNAGIGAHQ